MLKKQEKHAFIMSCNAIFSFFMGNCPSICLLSGHDTLDHAWSAVFLVRWMTAAIDLLCFPALIICSDLCFSSLRAFPELDLIDLCSDTEGSEYEWSDMLLDLLSISCVLRITCIMQQFDEISISLSFSINTNKFIISSDLTFHINANLFSESSFFQLKNVNIYTQSSEKYKKDSIFQLSFYCSRSDHMILFTAISHLVCQVNAVHNGIIPWPFVRFFEIYDMFY